MEYGQGMIWAGVQLKDWYISLYTLSHKDESKARLLYQGGVQPRIGLVRYFVERLMIYLENQVPKRLIQGQSSFPRRRTAKVGFGQVFSWETDDIDLPSPKK